MKTPFIKRLSSYINQLSSHIQYCLIENMLVQASSKLCNCQMKINYGHLKLGRNKVCSDYVCISFFPKFSLKTLQPLLWGNSFRSTRVSDIYYSFESAAKFLTLGWHSVNKKIKSLNFHDVPNLGSSMIPPTVYTWDAQLYTFKVRKKALYKRYINFKTVQNRKAAKITLVHTEKFYRIICLRENFEITLFWILTCWGVHLKIPWNWFQIPFERKKIL